MFEFIKKAGKWIGDNSSKVHKWVGNNIPSIEKIEKWAPRIGKAAALGLAATGFGTPLAAAAIGAGEAIGKGAGYLRGVHQGINRSLRIAGKRK